MRSRRSSSSSLNQSTASLKKSALSQEVVEKEPKDEATRLEEATKKLEICNARRIARAKVPANIGSFRISVVGDSGIGKTELVKALLSISEVANSEELPETNGSPSICEVRASTVAITDIHTGEDPFNITIVDTPGFGSTIDTLQVIRPVVDYHQQQFIKTDKVFTKDASSQLIMKFLKAGTGAHTHVDACIYGVLHRLTPVDIEFMKRLAPLVNVIPVILKCDTLTLDEVFKLKISILEEMQRNKIPMYCFGLSHDELLDLAKGRVYGAPPYTFASPSILKETGMRSGSSDSEFEQLKSGILYYHIDDLRALTADKFVGWRQASRR